jgi:biotin carboxyl carrier protein
MIFKVLVNSDMEYNITSEDLSELDAVKISDSKYHVLHDNISYQTEIIYPDFNKKIYKVKVNNNTYNINIYNKLDAPIENMGFALGTSKHINKISAPMPGLILDIQVTIGQKVEENHPLFILEAMKMENSIMSPRAGIIKSISVKKGDAVLKNQLIIEFDA